MSFAQTALQVYGWRQVALPVMWGAAAWVQSQSTPGASALAAPHQFCFELSGRRRVEQTIAGSRERSQQ